MGCAADLGCQALGICMCDFEETQPNAMRSGAKPLWVASPGGRGYADPVSCGLFLKRSRATVRTSGLP